MRSARNDVLQFARSAPPDFWHRPSPDEGWTCKDIMSHLAAGTNKQLQAILRSVVTKTRLDPGLFGNVDDVNGREVRERRGRPIATIIDEYEADTSEILELLSQVKEEDKDLRQKDFDTSFGNALPIFARHEHEHLAQLRSATEAKP
jgi:hypothetical protein